MARVEQIDAPAAAEAHDGTRRGDRIVLRLRRRTSGGAYDPKVDGIRFIAIASVFVFHVQRSTRVRAGLQAEEVFGDLNRFLSQGRLGVLVFFALSGYILSQPFIRHRLAGAQPVSLGRYYLRRLTRIEPPYLVALLLCSLVIALTPWWQNLDTTQLATRAALGSVYAHTAVMGTPNLINPPFWTLEIEIQFYVIVPLLALVFLIRSTPWRRVALAGSILYVTVFQLMANLRMPAPHAFGAVWNYLQFFLIGFLVADLLLRTTRHSRWWDLVSLIGWPLFFWLGSARPWFVYLIVPWLLLLLFLAVFLGHWTSRLFSNRWLATIGGMTYSIYLIHAPLIGIIVPMLLREGFVDELDFSPWLTIGLTPLLALITLLFALPFYLLVEQPCMDPRWPQKLWARVRPRRRAAPSAT